MEPRPAYQEIATLIELRRQAAINAVSRVNADVSCREILATHPDGSRMVLVRYPAEYLIHRSNKFHCAVALRKFGKHQDIFDLDNGTPVDLEDYMTKTHIVDARKIKAAELFLFGQYFTKPAYRIEAFKKLQGQVTAFKARINAIRFEEEKALGL